MIDRRTFLQQSLALVSLGIGVPGIFSRGVLAASAEAASASVSGKTLVVVQLAGGLDWLNTFVPYTDGAYRRARKTLGIAESDLLPVSDRVAFHPSLSALAQTFKDGKMAIIEGAGYANPNYSHFKAMDIWQTADLDGTAHDGWLGRYFDDLTDTAGHPLTGLSVGRSLPASFGSTQAAMPAVESIDSYALKDATGDNSPATRRDSLMKLYDYYRPANTPFAALLDTTLDNAYASSQELRQAATTYKPATTYPQSSLASGLQLLAEYIAAAPAGQSPLRVGHVTLGGFDTHTQEATRLAPLLTQTSEALSAFLADIDAHGHADDVIVLVWTEFGRRVGENAQDGTDHGSAGNLVLLGNKVKGGFYGEPVSLTNLDNGNLRYTTDFRRVYATVLEKWLQAPSDDVLGGRFETMDLLKA